MMKKNDLFKLKIQIQVYSYKLEYSFYMLLFAWFFVIYVQKYKDDGY